MDKCFENWMIFSLWICCVIERLAVVARTVLAAYFLLYWAELQYWRWHAYSTVKEKKEMGMREMKHHNPLYVNFLFLPALVLTSLDYVYRPVKYFSSACRILPNSYSAELSSPAAIPLAPTVTALPSGWKFPQSERELKEFSEEIHPLNTEWNERKVFVFLVVFSCVEV